ncbi:MAG: patatin-like phospholipase family protein [Spirochaetia bacterium]|nr:patatin-like phospholipase family protein [Spirochaetia bacterium]
MAISTETIASYEIFREMPGKQVSEILSYFKKVKVKKGSKLYAPKDAASYLYVVLTGEFKVEVKEDAKFRIIGYSRASDIIGEMSILSDKPRSARVTAVLDSEVLRITKENINMLFVRYPKLVINIGHIQAERLQQNLHATAKQIFQKHFIAHFSAFNEIESHYIGLNLAATIAETTKSPVAYLHFSSYSVSPVKTLQCKVKIEQTISQLERFQKKQSFSVKELLHEHDSGIWFLPCINHRMPIDYLKLADIARLLGFLSKEFPVIFMELGSENLENKKTVEVLKQADFVISGISAYDRSIKLYSKYVNYFNKYIKDFDAKLSVYQNSILIQEKLEKFRKNIFAKRIYFSQIERELGHSIDFKIHGRLQSLSEYIPTFTYLEQINQAVFSLQSMARWIIDRNIGLALGGGGARGMAEIGVLRVLEKENIQFDMVAGTSMGSLIGALYAMRYDSYQIENVFSKFIPKDKVFTDYNLPFISFFRGRKMNRLLRKAFGKLRFEDLSIPFVCVTVDLLTGKEVRIDKGFLWRAVRASMSLPVVFPPMKYRRHYLVDGGVLNNVPGDILREKRVHRVLGVNCTPFEDDSLNRYIKETSLFSLLLPNKKFLKNVIRFFIKFYLMVKRPPLLQIANRAMMLEGAELVRSKSHHFDLMLSPDVRSFALFDFQKRKEIIEKGVKEAEDNLDLIKQIFKPKES